MSEYTFYIFDKSQVIKIYHFDSFEALCFKVVKEQLNSTFENATDGIIVKGKDTIGRIYY